MDQKRQQRRNFHSSALLSLFLVTLFRSNQRCNFSNDSHHATVVMAAHHSFGRIDRLYKSSLTSESTNRIDLYLFRGGGPQQGDDRTHDVDNQTIPNTSVFHLNDGNHDLDDPIDTQSISAQRKESMKRDQPTTEVTSDSNNNSHDDEDMENDISHNNNDDDSSPVLSTDDISPTSTSESVGVKQQVKKSNAVGDPDGEGSSDDDEDDSISDWDEEALSVLLPLGGDKTEENPPLIVQTDEPHDNADDVAIDRVQVEVEYTVEEEDDDDDDTTNAEAVSTAATTFNKENNKRSKNIGGVIGVRSLGQRLKNRSRKNHDIENQSKVELEEKTQLEQYFQEAWQPHIFFAPPPPATNNSFWQYLQDHRRSIDSDGKIRLDRRTLYAGLLSEWTTPTPFATAISSKKNANYRKFFDSDTSQALQAALSLATQPIWRKSLQRPSAIRFYNNNNDVDTNHRSSTTLAMQETVALGLAHSLGAGLVVLDDSVLASVRQFLLRNGCSDNDTKPAMLIQSLLAIAKQGIHRPKNVTIGATISDCMRSDLFSGMDDPYDERATSSCEEMVKWETCWQKPSKSNESTFVCDDVPLVIFLRTQQAKTLLKSKAAVELILTECNSSDSQSFLVLGSGIDVTTMNLPPDIDSQDQLRTNQQSSQQQSQALQGSAPWFGFTPHNQNASGQNDPEGSRRFNIFLARTVDQNGKPGLVGAVAPPEAGNLFPHMMAMQARLQLEQHSDEDSPMRAELERWAQMLQQQIQMNGGNSLPAPQFFNATISRSNANGDKVQENTLPSAEVIQQTLEHAMSELLDSLAQMSEDGAGASPGQSPELQKAFAQVLRNENLRRGIAENLARAAPALSDPKCQGVLLSVFVPAPSELFQRNSEKSLGESNKPYNMGSWFQKMLSHQEEADKKKDPSDENRKASKEKRVRTMAAAAAVVAAQNTKSTDSKRENKVEKNLSRLEAISRPLVVQLPTDPVRAKSWEAWIRRERGAVIFRQNRRVLNEQLEKRFLSLQEHTGTKGAGSALRQMLSARLLATEMGDVIQRAIELEAAKSQRRREPPNVTRKNENDLDVDITLSQLLLTADGLVATEEVLNAPLKKDALTTVQFIHPSSLEAALASVCRINPSPGGGLSLTTDTVSHRTKEEVSALAQDKHERALISQVVSPQDIGVTYDMIGGLSEVKELLRQSITYPLKFPHLYSEGIAREAVKGVLLFGPPGTGKTMLAKAVATEGGASFLSVDASSVENKWLGESEKNAKAVFTLARRLAPCVIFIDEVDSLLSSREGSSDDSAHGTLTSVKTTMMSEWDGLNSGTNGSGEAGSDRVIVIGSTNRPFDLDEAVLRRFPRRILVDLPDLETRTEILEVTLAENRLHPSVNLTLVAERLEGYTGSDIKECCREAVVQISHEQARVLDQGFQNAKEDMTEGSMQRLRPVTMDDFDKALKKLKRSVSENGRELARVWEWNDEYGEIKRDKKNPLPHLANMYL